MITFTPHVSPAATLRAAHDAIAAAATLEACGCRVTGAHAHGALAVVCINRPPVGMPAIGGRSLDYEILRAGSLYGVRIEEDRR